jgi:hypothetical protein
VQPTSKSAGTPRRSRRQTVDSCAERFPLRALGLSLEFGRTTIPNDPRFEQFGNEILEVAAAKQMARNAGGRSGGAVRFLVADEKTRGAIDRPALEKIQYHPGSGLPPVADAAVFWHRCLGVKRAIADVVETRSDPGQLDGQLRM